MTHALQQAIAFHRQGRLVDAERLYCQALRAKTRDFDALHMLGILKLQQNDAEQAACLFEAALAADPASAAAHSNYGAALSALGRHEQALLSYERALALNPANAEALSNRGDALCDLGRFEEALASYEQALAINPRLIPALVNRGVLLRNLGRLAEAISDYEKALVLDPRHAQAWNNHGIALCDLGRETQALASYERALALQPDFLEALVNRGNVVLELRRPAEALASYGRALALKPDFAAAHKNRGHALYDLGRFVEALASYDEALAAEPADADAAFHRTRALGKLNQHAQAIVELSLLRKRRADVPNLLGDLAHCKAVTCDWSDAAGLIEELGGHATAGTAPVDPFMFLSFWANSEQQLACARNWLRRKKIVGVHRAWNRADFAGDRLRVAYLSADFHRHATAYLMAELFEIHDRKRFEIVGISFGPDDRSPLRSRVIAGFDRFFDVTTRTDQEIAKLIRDLKVNIAIDLKGHTTDARIGIFADRAAPIQAGYLGYPGSTGADFLDYIIADTVVLPFDQQPWYTEKIVHLPDCYQVNDSKRSAATATPLRSEVGLPETGFVFCCFNNTWKINPQLFDIWMRLLRRVHGSVLWLLETNELAVANLRKEASARRIDPARLVFAPRVDLPEHLARHRLANLFLDTLPYNAHTTSSDSLWAGVPVVTATGDRFAGRVAASLLNSIGLPQLATASLADYEALALKLATEPALLEAVRRDLETNRHTLPLFDCRRFCRHIEAAYATMWEIWLSGEGPRSFSVEPCDG
ncbi:MAG TPA: tetratricopeptide repeat protein [Xanthobacteraceae bacterium]|jgi:predicted O-linked N-acetylglucosamine transferase (SPINDLY family)